MDPSDKILKKIARVNKKLEALRVKCAKPYVPLEYGEPKGRCKCYGGTFSCECSWEEYMRQD